MNLVEPPHDAILIVGFGGPEKPDDVMPFLENVTRGRNVPRERLLEVAEHYQHFGGVSPINGQVRALIDALGPVLRSRGIALPIYWGNRNWHPLLADTLKTMTEAGRRRAIGVVLAAYSSYSSCRQYREDVERAREAAGLDAPAVDKVRVFFNHPDFIAVNAQRARAALETLPEALRHKARFAFSAHSIPNAMARNCRYEEQLFETSRLVAESLGLTPDRWKLVYQSRSGRPSDPWLEPDILDHIAELSRQGAESVVIVPVGFLSDHMEILFDLDEEARQKCDALGMAMARAETVGTHPRFVSMLAELIQERIERPPGTGPRAIGHFPASHDVCPVDCCLPALGDPDEIIMNHSMQVLICLLTSCVAARAEPPSHADEMKRHQGTWLVVSFERNGQETPKDVTDTIVRLVENDHVVWKRDGKSFAGTSMVLDPKAEPHAIDLVPDGGRARDKRVLGIYKLDGDTLTICVADPDTPRPTAFAAPKGSGRTLQTFRRKPK